ncbi:MAG: substrate-binding domain-containing protein, partial [Butyricicoccaceae bacterium]
MTKISKKLLSMIMAGAMCVSLTACGGSGSNSDSGDSAGSSGDGYKISMIMKTTAAEYWQIVQAGGEAYAKEHPDVVSEVSVKGPPSETSYEDQLNMLQTDLSQDYDGYLIAPLQSDSVADQIAGTDKPVVAFDTNVDSEKCLSFVGTGNKEAAKMGGEAAVEAAKAAGWTEIKCI